MKRLMYGTCTVWKKRIIVGRTPTTPRSRQSENPASKAREEKVDTT